jgi:hypothetical protein
MVFALERSTNLSDRTTLETVTNLTGTLEFRDGNAVPNAASFYRAVQR